MANKLGKLSEISEEKIRKFHEYTRAQGLKTTKQRGTILDVFFRMKGHISVEELYDVVKTVNPRIGYATVYRTLHLLVDSGQIEERRFGDGMSRYEGHSEVERHGHMICEECGQILEFFNEELEALQIKLAGELQFNIHYHRHELFGSCMDSDACAKRRKKNPKLK